MEKQFFVYVLASAPKGTLYVGVTSNLPQRIWQHRNKVVEGFTQKYDVYRLVYFEPHESAYSAMTREKLIKKWQRAWKMRLIEKANPHWLDLYDDILR